MAVKLGSRLKAVPTFSFLVLGTRLSDTLSMTVIDDDVFAMPDNVDNLVLEHLRHIRGRVDQISDDMRDVKHRLSTLESSIGSVRREVLIGDETGARQQASIDRILDRLESI